LAHSVAASAIERAKPQVISAGQVAGISAGQKKAVLKEKGTTGAKIKKISAEERE